MIGEPGDFASDGAGLIPIASPIAALPVLVGTADAAMQMRFLEFFAVTVRDPHTRRTYARGCGEFLGWCADHGLSSITAV